MINTNDNLEDQINNLNTGSQHVHKRSLQKQETKIQRNANESNLVNEWTDDKPDHDIWFRIMRTHKK